MLSTSVNFAMCAGVLAPISSQPSPHAKMSATGLPEKARHAAGPGAIGEPAANEG